jgi:hypothetical protein
MSIRKIFDGDHGNWLSGQITSPGFTFTLRDSCILNNMHQVVLFNQYSLRILTEPATKTNANTGFILINPKKLRMRIHPRHLLINASSGYALGFLSYHDATGLSP